MSYQSLPSMIGNVRKAMRREFEERAAPIDITVPQLLVLKRLWEGDGILTSVLTTEINCDGGTATGILDRLETKGYLRRERCTHDRRAVRLFLTQKGRELEGPVTALADEVSEKMLRGFTGAEREQLFTALERVERNLNE